jgi:glycosyltransferase involved in cell wall biosynthesis
LNNVSDDAARPRLLLFKETDPPVAGTGDTLMEFAGAKRELISRPAATLFRYRDVTLVSERLGLHAKPLFSAVVARALSRGRCRLADKRGGSEPLGFKELAALAAGAARDRLALRGLLRRLRAQVDALASGTARPPRPAPAGGRPLYLRTDLLYGIRSGGSVGHIAGVLNNLDAWFGMPEFLTTDDIPTVRADIPKTVVLPDRRYLDFAEVPGLAFNEKLYTFARARFDAHPPAFIYQRYSVNNFAGARLARHWGVPFVLEYNGSEIWIARNWGKPLRYESLSEAIELADLTVADLIVVVSRPMKDELTARGVDPSKILVNPNGVDPEAYSPAIDSSAVRRRLGLEGKIVIGFIGTFGRWHGAEMLAEAFGRLLERRPDLADRARLLLIGDGQMLPQVKEAIARHGTSAQAVLTGLVPQKEGPAHLAACDILASPHVPNPDGTPFFGSPTKLFEYMAMGKGIVASDLDQIGEILEHDRTAWMVKPGDADSLADGLRALIEDAPLRERLGREARARALADHTWKEHTRKIVAALRERVG